MIVININTSTIINNIKKDIQKKIDMEQKKLEDIKEALNNAEQFLLENGYTEITDNIDILKETIKVIKDIKEKRVNNNRDIKNIKESIHILKDMNNSIDDNVFKSLEKKIKEIENNIKQDSDKLESVNCFLTVLLNLNIICPVCSKDKSGYNNCSYCEGVGYLTISKVLINERIIEPETIDDNIQKIQTPATEKLKSLQQQGYSKYVVNNPRLK